VKTTYQTLFAVLIIWISTSAALADLPFLKPENNEIELPRAYGLGLKLYHSTQDFDINSLDFTLPNVEISDPSVIGVESDIKYADVRLDAWVFPFLNVFVSLGRIDGSTTIDLNEVSLPQLPIALGIIDVDYDGTVYGAGATTTFGGRNWFASLTFVFTNSDLEGEFNSRATSTTIQPRVGWRFSRGNLWVGAHYLDAEQSHTGNVDLGIPGVPAVPFDVELTPTEPFNFKVGGNFELTDRLEATVEIGFAERRDGLVSLTWRF